MYLLNTQFHLLFVIVTVMKENDINEMVKSNNFFNQCSSQLQSMIQKSQISQMQHQHKRKMKQLSEVKIQNHVNLGQILLHNIFIDYLRTNNLNYSYTVFMREVNLISDDVMSKNKIAQTLHLQQQLNKSQSLSPSLLEILLNTFSDMLPDRRNTGEAAVQVQIHSENRINYPILRENIISEIRQEVEDREKKHYLKLLDSFKEQQFIHIKRQHKQEHERTIKDIKKQYEAQIDKLKEKNFQETQNDKSLSKMAEYLQKISLFQKQIDYLKEANKQLQKYKISHDCLKSEKIIQKQLTLKKQRDYLEEKKTQLDLAMRCMHTKVQDLIQQKQKIRQINKTDDYLTNIKQQKANKDYMIQQIYGRMFALDKRIELLSKDNEQLRELNRQFKAKAQESQQILQSFQKITTNQHSSSSKLFFIKPSSKNISVGVSELDLFNHQEIPNKQISQSSNSSIHTEDQQMALDRRSQFNKNVYKLHSEMKLLKNKVRLLVEEFK